MFGFLSDLVHSRTCSNYCFGRSAHPTGGNRIKHMKRSMLWSKHPRRIIMQASTSNESKTEVFAWVTHSRCECSCFSSKFKLNCQSTFLYSLTPVFMYLFALTHSLHLKHAHFGIKTFFIKKKNIRFSIHQINKQKTNFSSSLINKKQ